MKELRGRTNTAIRSRNSLLWALDNDLCAHNRRLLWKHAWTGSWTFIYRCIILTYKDTFPSRSPHFMVIWFWTGSNTAMTILKGFRGTRGIVFVGVYCFFLLHEIVLWEPTKRYFHDGITSLLIESYYWPIWINLKYIGRLIIQIN